MSSAKSTSAKPTTTQVLVIGAGLAGLSAAQKLHRAGLDVHVVEAQSRVGGRTFSKTFGRATVDHGAQWIGSEHHRMLELARELKLTLFETWTTGRKILECCGDLSSYNGNIPSLPPLQLLELQLTIWRINRLARTVPRAHPLHAKKAKTLDEISLETYVQRHVRSRRVRGLLDAAVRVVWGAEAREISLLHFLWYVNSSHGLNNLVEVQNANQHWRVDGGTQQIAQGIAATLGEKVSLEQPVHSVCFDGDWYNVATAHSRFLAKAIVVAIPPHLTNRILFEPALGALRQQYCQRCPMGSTIKAHVRFPTPFWRDKGLSGEVVSDGKPLSVIYDDTDYAGTQPGLVAFMVADAAREAADLSPEERQAWVIRSLRRLLGNDVDAYLEYSDHIWATDPYTGGAPVAFHAPGALSSCGMALRKPIHNLFWAGTETAREWTGFMEGAVESGHRAAWEVLETL